jgi:hypothetical protein
MSLFDKLKDTKLKSLKFGSDKPGGGTSLEPVIQKPILDNNLVGQERSFNDVAEENRARIAKILKSTPRGTRFVRNQTGLQISNAHLETSNAPILNTINLGGGFIGAINKGINFINSANTKFNSTGLAQATRVTPLHVYSPEVTLAQLESIQGSHLDRFGLTPFIEDRYKYINIANANNTTKDNRLTKLRTKLNVGYNPDTTNPIPKKINKQIKGVLSNISSITNLAASTSNLFGGSPFLNKLNNTVNNVAKVVSPFLDPQIDQYTGGPDSRFGIGVTSIRRFDFTNKLDDFEKLRIASNIKAGNSRIDVNKYDELEKTATKEFIIADPEEGNNLDTDILFYSPNSSIAIKFKDLNVQKKKKHISYGGGTAAVDSLGNANYQYNAKASSPANITLDKNSPVFKYFGDKQTVGSFERNDGEGMTVIFQLINPFSGINLHRIAFPAYINGFKISSDATWNEISYIGRAENFYTFNKYKRTASFSLQIPCFNLVELREKHRALGALESSLAGRYGDDGKGTKLGGILTRLFLGNYLKGETGIINSLSYDIPNDSSWDIDEKLAHNINVSVSFTIIHNDLTTYNKDGGFFTRNIPNAAGGFISTRKAVADTGVNMEYTDFSTVTRTPDNSVGNTGGFSLNKPFNSPLVQSVFAKLPPSVMSPVKKQFDKFSPTLFP